jgi:hypothetical protein
MKAGNASVTIASRAVEATPELFGGAKHSGRRLSLEVETRLDRLTSLSYSHSEHCLVD